MHSELTTVLSMTCMCYLLLCNVYDLWLVLYVTVLPCFVLCREVVLF